MSIKHKKEVFYQNKSWNFIAKAINMTQYTIEYQIKTGYESEELAKKAKERLDRQYEINLARIKKQTNMSYSFIEYLEHYYQDFILPYYENSMIVVYHWTIYNIIIPNCEKDILLGAITANYVNKLLEKCSHYSSSAGAICLKVIRTCLNHALIENLLTESQNPIPALNHYEFKERPCVQLSRDEIKRLLVAMKNYPSLTFEFYMMCLVGLRLGEVLGLKNTDFDIENRTVTINRQITRDYKNKLDATVQRNEVYAVEKPPKTENSYRTIRVPEIIIDEYLKRKNENVILIDNLSPEQLKYAKTDYLCLGKDGCIKSQSTALCALKRICEKEFLPRLRVHDLRHVFATIVLESIRKEDLFEETSDNEKDSFNYLALDHVRKLLGHKYLETTFQIYIGVIDSMSDLREQINENFSPFNGMSSGKNKLEVS